MNTFLELLNSGSEYQLGFVGEQITYETPDGSKRDLQAIVHILSQEESDVKGTLSTLTTGMLQIRENDLGLASGLSPPVNLLVACSSAVNSGSGTAWTGLANITKSDDTYTAYTRTGGASATLECSFIPNIPNDAIISGITGLLEKSSVNVVNDAVIRLKKGSLFSSNKVAGVWPTTDTIVAHGGQTDLWGFSSISVAEARVLKLQIQALSVGIVSATGKLDQVQLQYTYSTPVITRLPLSKFIVREDTYNIDDQHPISKVGLFWNIPIWNVKPIRKSEENIRRELP